MVCFGISSSWDFWVTELFQFLQKKYSLWKWDMQFNFKKQSSLCNKIQSSYSIAKKSIFIQGHEISEWKYEVVALPKTFTLGNAMTSYHHSEISWPLDKTLWLFVCCYHIGFNIPKVHSLYNQFCKRILFSY